METSFLILALLSIIYITQCTEVLDESQKKNSKRSTFDIRLRIDDSGDVLSSTGQALQFGQNDFARQREHEQNHTRDSAKLPDSPANSLRNYWESSSARPGNWNSNDLVQIAGENSGSQVTEDAIVTSDVLPWNLENKTDDVIKTGGTEDSSKRVQWNINEILRMVANSDSGEGYWTIGSENSEKKLLQGSDIYNSGEGFWNIVSQNAANNEPNGNSNESPLWNINSESKSVNTVNGNINHENLYHIHSNGALENSERSLEDIGRNIPIYSKNSNRVLNESGAINAHDALSLGGAIPTEAPVTQKVPVDKPELLYNPPTAQVTVPPLQTIKIPNFYTAENGESARTSFVDQRYIPAIRFEDLSIAENLSANENTNTEQQTEKQPEAYWVTNGNSNKVSNYESNKFQVPIEQETIYNTDTVNQNIYEPTLQTKYVHDTNSSPDRWLLKAAQQTQQNVPQWQTYSGHIQNTQKFEESNKFQVPIEQENIYNIDTVNQNINEPILQTKYVQDTNRFPDKLLLKAAKQTQQNIPQWQTYSGNIQNTKKFGESNKFQVPIEQETIYNTDTVNQNIYEPTLQTKYVHDTNSSPDRWLLKAAQQTQQNVPQWQTYSGNIQNTKKFGESNKFQVPIEQETIYNIDTVNQNIYEPTLQTKYVQDTNSSPDRWLLKAAQQTQQNVPQWQTYSGNIQNTQKFGEVAQRLLIVPAEHPDNSGEFDEAFLNSLKRVSPSSLSSILRQEIAIENDNKNIAQKSSFIGENNFTVDNSDSRSPSDEQIWKTSNTQNKQFDYTDYSIRENSGIGPWGGSYTRRFVLPRRKEQETVNH